MDVVISNGVINLAPDKVAVFKELYRVVNMGHRDHHAPPETAREILDRRYAGGEITKEQYEEIKRSLGGR